MQIGDRTYIFLTCQRKAWHYDTPGWKEEAFERFNYVECAIFSKPTAELTEMDKMLADDYGEENDDFRWPGDYKLPQAA